MNSWNALCLLQREQIAHQEKMVAHFEHELLEHRKDPPEKGARSRLIQEYCKKENYLKSEVIILYFVYDYTLSVAHCTLYGPADWYALECCLCNHGMDCDC